jgi:LemA protein
MWALWIVLGLIVVFIVLVAGMYNKLIRGRARCNEAWAQIDVQLKRRYDLIPNLVNTVKGYASHERQVFENVTKARAQAIAAGTVGEQAEAENMLTGALRQLFAVVENYPELKANQNFLNLQEELSGTENRISFSRQHYNNTARVYNVLTQRVPTNIIAGLFAFRLRDYFEIEDRTQREAPVVEF